VSKKFKKNCVICEKLSSRSLQQEKINKEKKKKSAEKGNGGQILLLTPKA
jgi:hypothetical protein